MSREMEVPSPCQAPEFVRELLLAKVEFRDVLMRLAIAAQSLAQPGDASSILLIDAEGLLRNGASPSLPADYLAAIDGLRPHPEVGTCAAVAATGREILTPDFYSDDKWAELRHLPLALGFLGAWSTPIKSQVDGRVLGTFGTYFRQRRYPTPQERDGVRELALGAAMVLDEQSLS